MIMERMRGRPSMPLHRRTAYSIYTTSIRCHCKYSSCQFKWNEKLDWIFIRIRFEWRPLTMVNGLEYIIPPLHEHTHNQQKVEECNIGQN